MDILEIDLRIIDPRPCGFFQSKPALERIQPPFEHPFRLVLLGRNHPDRIFVQTLRSCIAFDNGLETVFVLVNVDLTDLINGLLHGRHGALQSRRVKAGSLLTSCGKPQGGLPHYVGRDDCSRYVICEKSTFRKQNFHHRVKRLLVCPCGSSAGH